MEGFQIFKEHYWKPFSHLGFIHPFFSINSHTIIFTWITLLIIFVVALLARSTISARNSIGYWMVTTAIRAAFNMTEQALGFFSFNHCAFITALFTFIVSCNLVSIIPWLEEPTTDLNTTLALGITSFCYNQWHAITSQGTVKYIKEYFSPVFLMLPINIIGKFASVISISFRLFGNIFGGSLLLTLYRTTIERSVFYQILGMASGLNLLLVFFFGICESFLQAFVFSMLALAHLGLCIQGEHSEDIS